MVGGRKTKIARFHHFLKVLTGEFSSHKMFNSELKHNEKSLSRVLFLKKNVLKKARRLPGNFWSTEKSAWRWDSSLGVGKKWGSLFLEISYTCPRDARDEQLPSPLALSAVRNAKSKVKVKLSGQKALFPRATQEVTAERLEFSNPPSRSAQPSLYSASFGLSMEQAFVFAIRNLGWVASSFPFPSFQAAEFQFSPAGCFPP